jgi:hypothetical protein
MNEATYSVTIKVNGDLFTVRGNNYDEFVENVAAAKSAVGFIKALQGGGATTPAHPSPQFNSTEVITNAFPGATVVSETPVAQAAPAAPAAIEVMMDRYGNEWTYGHPDAPALPDGRGKYAKKKGTSKAGKAYVGWFDPAKGPKPFAPGAVEAETIWTK